MSKQTDAFDQRAALAHRHMDILLHGGPQRAHNCLIRDAKALARKTGIDFNEIIDSAAADAHALPIDD